MAVYAGPADFWTDGTDAGRIHIATKGVIQSGLVLNLDAGASTSYPGSGTAWTDLSGNGNNGTLTNDPTYSSANGGAIVFDGVDDRGTFTSPITSSSPQTYEVWVKAIRSNSSSGGFGYILHNSSSSGQLQSSYIAIGYAGATLQTNEIFASFNAAWSTMGTGVIGNTTTVRQIVLTWNGSTQTAYIDGVQRVSQSLPSITGSFSTTTSFGDYSSATFRPIIGNVYSIKVYNRALSQAEILHNFYATRGRFGI